MGAKLNYAFKMKASVWYIILWVNLNQLTNSAVWLRFIESGLRVYIMYRIHSNKHPGCITKSLWVGAYFSQYFCNNQPKKNSINTRPDTLILWCFISIFDGWVLIGIWAVAGTNTVHEVTYCERVPEGALNHKKPCTIFPINQRQKCITLYQKKNAASKGALIQLVQE